MERMELKAVNRESGKGISKKIRNEGNVPAILYGVGRDPQTLSVNAKELDKVVSTQAGWNILLDLNIGGSDKVLTRITDYQADVLKRNITHIDFQVLDITKKIRTQVPLKFMGKPEGVKKGGILEIITRMLEVKCLPTEIPECIEVDVSALDIAQNIHVSTVQMPEGVECLYDTDFSIAAIVAPTEELTAELPVEGVEGAEAAAEGAEAAAEGAEGKAAEAGDAAKAKGSEGADKVEKKKE